MKTNKFWTAVSNVLAVVTIALIVVLILVPGASAASKYKVLYRFTGGTDGRSPDANVVFDSAGNLYSTTYGGGANGSGTVFELTPNSDGRWTEMVLYSFTGGADGGGAYAPLIFDAGGSLYSTTYYGGANGYGVVFELTPSSGGNWTETVIYSFQGGTDGARPVSGLIFDAAGNLYGMTDHGGKPGCNWYGGSGCGTVFELKPNLDGSWTESVLYAFAGPKDGGYPDHSTLILDAAGNLYGATSNRVFSCVNSCGTVFELTSNSDGSWTEKVLHRFTQKNGGNPEGSLTFDASGNLYGTTLIAGRYGMGNVFKLAPNSDGSWTKSVLHTFTGSKDGAKPWAGVIFDAAGNLYGTTSQGGVYGNGVVFKLVPWSGGKWHEYVLHSFKGGTDGGAPYGGVVFDRNGNLFDTTGGSGGNGTVFEIMK